MLALAGFHVGGLWPFAARWSHRKGPSAGPGTSNRDQGRARIGGLSQVRQPSMLQPQSPIRRNARREYEGFDCKGPRHDRPANARRTQPPRRGHGSYRDCRPRILCSQPRDFIRPSWRAVRDLDRGSSTYLTREELEACRRPCWCRSGKDGQAQSEARGTSSQVEVDSRNRRGDPIIPGEGCDVLSACEPVWNLD